MRLGFRRRRREAEAAQARERAEKRKREAREMEEARLRNLAESECFLCAIEPPADPRIRYNMPDTSISLCDECDSLVKAIETESQAKLVAVLSLFRPDVGTSPRVEPPPEFP